MPSTIINTIKDIDSSEYLLERNKIKHEEQTKYKQRIQYPCEIRGYKSLSNIIYKHKWPNTKIAMSFGRKRKFSPQAHICGIC